MSDFTDFFPAAGGGGGGIPKYQEFTASGTFTPSQDLIDAGGRIAYIVVGGGERGYGTTHGGCGGAVISGYTTLNSTTGCAITIGAGGANQNDDGGASGAAFASAGGTTIAAKGGSGLNAGYYGAAGAYNSNGYSTAAATGTMGMFGRGGGGAGGGNMYGSDPESNGAYGAGASYTYGNGPAGNGFVRITWFE